MNTADAIKTAVTLLATTFNREVSDTLLDAYWTGLSGLSAQELSAATKRALAECKFMPPPAVLLKYARPPRNLEAEAAIAWEAVRRAIDCHDWSVSSIDFGSHVNAVVRQLGGWDALCRAALADLDIWKRKEFERLYLALADQNLEHIGQPLDGPRDGIAGQYPHATVAIEGLPSQPPKAPSLPPIPNGVSKIIRDLGDAKS